MASFDTMETIATQTTFLRRVKYAMNKAAVAIMAEDVGTASHAERVIYAKTILDGTASISDYSSAVVTNATLTAAGDLTASPLHGIVDTDLEFTVNSMFNAMAGVST